MDVSVLIRKEKDKSILGGRPNLSLACCFFYFHFEILSLKRQLKHGRMFLLGLDSQNLDGVLTPQHFFKNAGNRRKN